MARALSGLFAVHKPDGITSMSVVRRIQQILPPTTPIGHGGALDAPASGVLVIGVGAGTKSLAKCLSGKKRYVAQVRLGLETDTLDRVGNSVRECEWKHVTRDSLEKAMKQFIGPSVLQRPPKFSSLRVPNAGGKRAHEFARKGEEVSLLPRPVCIDSIQLRNFHLPHFEIEVSCGGGTYIRSLVADIATAVHSCGILSSLVRTEAGGFTLSDCLRWEEDLLHPTKNEGEDDKAKCIASILRALRK